MSKFEAEEEYNSNQSEIQQPLKSPEFESNRTHDTIVLHFAHFRIIHVTRYNRLHSNIYCQWQYQNTAAYTAATAAAAITTTTIIKIMLANFSEFFFASPVFRSLLFLFWGCKCLCPLVETCTCVFRCVYALLSIISITIIYWPTIMRAIDAREPSTRRNRIHDDDNNNFDDDDYDDDNGHSEKEEEKNLSQM